MKNFLQTAVKLFVITILWGIGVSLSAQDLLVFTDGSIEQVKLLEIGDDIVKYKKWNNLDGPTFSTNRANIFSVKYQDGTEEKINQTTASQQNRPTSKRYPQSRDGGVSIHLGGVFPVGQFGEDTKLYYGWDVPYPNVDRGFGAGLGFNVGIKGKIPLAINGLGVIISGDFIFNGIKGQLKEDYDRLQAAIEDAYGSFKRPRYINIPIFMGVNYKYSINQNFAVWIDGGLGPNFRTATAAKYKDENGFWKKATFPIKVSFALQVGTGIIINDFFSIGLHYYGLGAAKIKYKYTNNVGGSSTNSTIMKYSQNCFMIRLGFHF